MGETITLFAVVNGTGKIRRSKTQRHRNLMVYDSFAKARGQARDDGDSVVEIEVNLNRQPRFIRSKTVTG